MNIFFRILLAIYAVCLVFISLITMVITFRIEMFQTIANYINDNALQSVNTRVIFFFLAVLFFILNLVYLFSGLKENKDKHALNKRTEIGQIKIYLDTIENIALSASRKISGVRDTKAYIKKIEENVSITIKVVVMADVNIPTISEDIQVKVKSAVEETTGVIVNDVKIVVENVYSTYKATRVE